MLQIAALDLLARGIDAAAVQSAALGPVSADRVAVYARHTAHPGFRAFGAFDADALVGFGYGAQCRPGQWWFDQLRPALSTAGYAGWVEDAYAVTELHVLPAYQGRRLGLALITELLSDAGAPYALLSTYDVETPARRLYRGLGFVDLLTGFRFGGAAHTYVLMAAPLPLNVVPGQSRTPRPAAPRLA